MHLVGFTIEIYYDARSYERHTICTTSVKSGVAYLADKSTEKEQIKDKTDYSQI